MRGSMTQYRTWLFIAGIAAMAAFSQQASSQTPRIEDRRLGEEEQIRLREEWFFSTRTAGTVNAAERRALRLQAGKQTRQAIELQRGLRGSGGRGAQQNFWVSKGPSPSTFGGRLRGRAGPDWAPRGPVGVEIVHSYRT